MQLKTSALNRPNETCIKVSKPVLANKQERRRRVVAHDPPWPIEMASPRSLHPAERNARTHSQGQIKQVANSIGRFGFITPIIVDGRGRIVAGHARAEAAKLLGLRQVPIIRVGHLSETELRAYALADNRLAENSGWDRETLAIELGELQVALPEIDLDIGITGFEPGEVDTILTDFASQQPNPADEIPELDAGAVVAQRRDLFVLGRHRLLVGDARDQGAYVELMQNEVAEMAFLDPPYVAGALGARIFRRRGSQETWTEPGLRGARRRSDLSDRSRFGKGRTNDQQEKGLSNDRPETGGRLSR
jgi:ParB-like chromosome segregation protein Spo0J